MLMQEIQKCGGISDASACYFLANNQDDDDDDHHQQDDDAADHRPAGELCSRDGTPSVHLRAVWQFGHSATSAVISALQDGHFKSLILFLHD